MAEEVETKTETTDEMKEKRSRRGRPSKRRAAAAEAAAGETGVPPAQAVEGAVAPQGEPPAGTTGVSPVAVTPPQPTTDKMSVVPVDATLGPQSTGGTGVSPVHDGEGASVTQGEPQSAVSAQNPPQNQNPNQIPGGKRLSKKQRWLQRLRNRNGGGWNPQGGQPPPPQVPRNPDLPEYKLADIHSWDNATIIEKMWPDANAEDLGAMKRHEIIFNAIRSYLARGGAVLASGCLEIVREGYGYLRSAKTNFLSCPEDVFVPQQQIRRHMLRPGDTVEGPLRDPRDRDRYFGLGGVVTVNGKTPSEAARIVHFENLVPTFPTRRIVLETSPNEYSTRVVDIFTPIGFGQRGLIVAPPRVGKTVLLQKMANAITANHPDAMLIVLLIDERPEEVTDMQRNTKAIVLSSTFDEEPQHHVNVAEMTGEMARRQVENGRDVIILLDSITRLARAYNTVQPHSGKILTGGVDALALHRPKRFFGAARNIEGGGSLTILATAFIDTGSRMDEVIFEEFKGTGNMELVLDRGLADKRIFPAIDIEKSGTRKEDLLLDPMELEKTWALRRVLADAGPERAMQSVLNGMKKIKTNPAFLLSLDLKNL